MQYILRDELRRLGFSCQRAPQWCRYFELLTEVQQEAAIGQLRGCAMRGRGAGDLLGRSLYLVAHRCVERKGHGWLVTDGSLRFMVRLDYNCCQCKPFAWSSADRLYPECVHIWAVRISAAYGDCR